MTVIYECECNDLQEMPWNVKHSKASAFHRSETFIIVVVSAAVSQHSG